MDAAPLPPIVSPPHDRTRSHVVVVLFMVTFAILIFRGYGARYATQPTVQQSAVLQASVDLNRVDRTELLQIPGVGPNMADAILTYRHERGTFASVEDLEAVHGIGGKTLDKLRKWVHVQDAEPQVERLQRRPVVLPVILGAKKITASDAAINVNLATLEELQRLPGIGVKIAERIIEARKAKPFVTIEDLRKVSGIGAKTLDKLKPYICLK